MNKLLRVIKHRWFDASDARRAVPDEMAERLTQRVTASEQRHTGEIRLCVEAALPTADLWRISPDMPLPQVVRERALEWFGRLGIWDTEDNNGVLTVCSSTCCWQSTPLKSWLIAGFLVECLRVPGMRWLLA